MANQNSQIINDLSANPPVKTNQQKIGGRFRVATETLLMTSGVSGDIKRLVPIPSRAVVLRVEIANDDLDSNVTPNLTADVGLYRTTADGGAVVRADFFASAITQLRAPAEFTDVTYESGVVTVANRARRVWEQLGLPTDPRVDYDVALTYTASAATHANGSVTIRITYVLPE